MSYIVNFTNKDKCSNCGRCCTDFAIISDKEIDIIKKYIAKNNIKEQYGAVLDDGRVPMMCPFRDEDNKKCLIYPVRPMICKKFKCNMSDTAIVKLKNVPKDQFYNVEADSILSWHLVFYDNELQQLHYFKGMDKVRTLLRR